MNDIIKPKKPSVLDISGVLNLCWSVLQTLQLVRSVGSEDHSGACRRLQKNVMAVTDTHWR